MQNMSLEIPTPHMCIDKAVDSVINKHKDLNKRPKEKLLQNHVTQHTLHILT